jgi:hypothetical protein
MDNQAKIKELSEENAKLKEELQSTKEHLKKYTAPSSNKVYYEKHKDEHKHRVSEYKKKTNYKSTPEQRKEYNRQSYLLRKEKLKKENEEKQNDENI